MNSHTINTMNTHSEQEFLTNFVNKYFSESTPAAGGFMVLCPAHNDKKPSLKVSCENGRILMHCFAGCLHNEILHALKIPANELYMKCVPNSGYQGDKSAEGYTASYGLTTEDFLNFDAEFYGERCNFPYSGGLMVRKTFARKDGKREITRNFTAGKPKTPASCYFPNIPLDYSKPLFITEGEEKALALRACGLQAITFGGTNEVSKNAEFLHKNFENIIVWTDNDGAGRKCAAKCKALGLATVDVSETVDGSDINDLLISNGKDYVLKLADKIIEGDEEYTDDQAARILLSKMQSLVFLEDTNEYGIKENVGIYTKKSEKQLTALMLGVCSEIGGNYDSESEYHKAFLSYQKSMNITRKALANVRLQTVKESVCPYLIGTPEGVFDIAKGQFVETDEIICTSAAVDPEEGPTPCFDKFCENILQDSEERETLLKYLALSLTGYTNLRLGFICVGGSGQGKTQLSILMREILGGYSVDLPAEAISYRFGQGATSGHNGSIADLAGKRFATMLEAAKSKIDTELFKKIVGGGDEISARHIYGENIKFSSYCKLFIFANDMPTFDVYDDAIKMRARSICFDSQAAGRHTPSVITGMHKETCQIFHKLLMAAKDLIADDLLTVKEINAPPTFMAQAEDFASVDIINAFINENLTKSKSTEGSSLGRHEIFCRYKRFCFDTGVTFATTELELFKQVTRRMGLKVNVKTKRREELYDEIRVKSVRHIYDPHAIGIMWA